MDSFTGGVFTANGEFVETSLLERGAPAELREPVEYLRGTYIFGGCLFGHFGHFIWESLSRVHAIRQCREYPILFISPNDRVYESQKIFFKAIGIRNEICVVKVPASVEKLVYSDPGSTVHPAFMSDAQIASLQYFTFSEKSNERIWLSRSRLPFGKVTNERIIEDELEKIGYRIVYPETLPLREQVRLLSTSAIVAGFDGSAFFPLLFATKIHGKFFVFNRRLTIPQTLPYIFTRRNLGFEQGIFDLEPVDTEWPVALYHHPAPMEIIEILGHA